MRREEYTERVLAAMHRVTIRERDAICAELDGHIEDRIEALLELGYEPELAEERVMARMGDPEEVGRELDKQYPRFWLIAEWVLKTLVCVLALVLVFDTLTMYSVWDSLQARMEPYEYAGKHQLEHMNMPLDIRREIGSDILHIYGSGTNPNGEIHVLYYWYDQDLLGYVTGENVELVDCRGEQVLGGGGWSRSSRLSSCDSRGTVQNGDPYVTVVVVRFDERYEIQVPLKWEEVQA
jgi:hypothetical protein